jgi:TolA-binding protein
MSLKDAYIEKMEAQLKQINAKIEELRAKAQAAEAEARLEYYRTLEDLESQREIFRTKLVELRRSSEEAWEDLQGGLDAALLDIKRALEVAVSRFR